MNMSEAAGAVGTNKGVSAGGARLKFRENAVLGAFNYYGWDTYNTLYVEANWNSVLLRDYGIKLGAQFSNQKSVGDELVGDFETNQFGINFSGSYNNAVITLGYTITDDDGAIRSDWGEPPGYNFRPLQSFDRAGEQSVKLGISLTDKSPDPFPLSGSFNITHGFDAEDEGTGAGLSDVTEYDVWGIFKPKGKHWGGIDFRVLFAYSDFDDGTDRWNTRVILNYPFRLL